MTPADASKDSNQLYVMSNLELRALMHRRYAPLNVDDNVNIMRMKKSTRKNEQPNVAKTFTR